MKIPSSVHRISFVLFYGVVPLTGRSRMEKLNCPGKMGFSITLLPPVCFTVQTCKKLIQDFYGAKNDVGSD